MGTDKNSKLKDVLRSRANELITGWTSEQLKNARPGLISEAQLRDQTREFLRLLNDSLSRGSLERLDAPEWAEVRQMLAELSRMRSVQGFTPTETATFVFSLKAPLFDQLREAHGSDLQRLADDIWSATGLLDRLGLWTAEAYQKAREELIRRQQEDMLELSTPVVKLWDGILALPVIGTLDSARSQVVMESLLQQIVATGSTIAIIDITGVPAVDTLTAQHLLKTVTAARLMGADCIISGIRPQIAQTIVHLGVELEGVTTKATLASAFALALTRLHLMVVRKPNGRPTT